MISFRYHVVSLVGVFLALALGIVVGTTALNGPITDSLRGQVDSLSKSRNQLSDQVDQLTAQNTDADSFAQNYGSRVVKGTLTGRTVVLVGMPGSPSSARDAVAAQLAAAGATVSGRVLMTADYFNPARAADIRALVTNGSQPTGLELPATDDAGQLGGALLAYVLSGKGSSTDLSQTLAAFSTLQLLSVEGSDNVAAGDTVVLVSGAAPADAGVAKNQVTFATMMQRAKAATAVAGTAESDAGLGLVAQIRADGTAAKTITTVDDAGTSLGQVALVLALGSKAAPAAYGTGPGASAPFPSPAG